MSHPGMKCWQCCRFGMSKIHYNVVNWNVSEALLDTKYYPKIINLLVERNKGRQQALEHHCQKYVLTMIFLFPHEGAAAARRKILESASSCVQGDNEVTSASAGELEHSFKLVENSCLHSGSCKSSKFLAISKNSSFFLRSTRRNAAQVLGIFDANMTRLRILLPCCSRVPALKLIFLYTSQTMSTLSLLSNQDSTR